MQTADIDQEAAARATAIDRKATALASQSAEIAVTDAASYAVAAEFLRGVKRYREEVAEAYDSVIEAAHKSHKAALAKKKQYDDPADAAERAAKGKRAPCPPAAQARRAAEARAAEADQRRLEEDARVAEAAALEKSGDGETAAAVLAAPAFVPPVIAPRAAPKIAGVSMRDNWSAQVTDLRALVLAVAAGKADLGLLLPNQPALNARARSEKARLAVPGVRAVNAPSPNVSTR